MEVYRERIYEYDNGGNLTSKKIAEVDDWIEYTFTYARGYQITQWDLEISSGTLSETTINPTYDDNGNLTGFDGFTITNGPDQFEMIGMTFTYDRKNRLQTYQYGDGPTKTLTWDALGRIREKTWTEDSTDYHQVFYHSGRQLVQIWNETVDGYDVTREIAYDLFSGQAGYLKDIDFESDPDNEGYLIKDAQGTVRAIVNVTYSGGTYTVTTERYELDGYGATLNFDSYPHDNGTHYMRYISCRVEDYADSDNETQALIHTDYRHYLPHFGIFLQREPLLIFAYKSPLNSMMINPIAANPYRYSVNEPIYQKDPSGLIPSQWGNCIDRLLQAFLDAIKYVDRVSYCAIIYNKCWKCCWMYPVDIPEIVECVLDCERKRQFCLWAHRLPLKPRPGPYPPPDTLKMSSDNHKIGRTADLQYASYAEDSHYMGFQCNCLKGIPPIGFGCGCVNELGPANLTEHISVLGYGSGWTCQWGNCISRADKGIMKRMKEKGDLRGICELMWQRCYLCCDYYSRDEQAKNECYDDCDIHKEDCLIAADAELRRRGGKKSFSSGAGTSIMEPEGYRA